MINAQKIIDQTKKWINDVVVGCNFCPFAANTMKQKTVHYQVETIPSTDKSMQSLLNEMKRLDAEPNIETTFIIFPDSYKQFDEYLDMVSLAEKLLRKNGYEGVYQLASFHPLYMFANSSPDDAANYTNRSVYPMLHLLREESIEKALAHYQEPETIPVRNVNFARNKGLVYMKMLRDACLKA